MTIGWLDRKRDWIGKLLKTLHGTAVYRNPFENGGTWDHFFLHYTDIPKAFIEAEKLEQAIPGAMIWVYGGDPIKEEMLPRTSRVVPVRYRISRRKLEAPPRFLRLLETLDPDWAQPPRWPENLVAIHLLCRARELRNNVKVEIDQVFAALTALRTEGRKEYYELTGNELAEGKLSELCGPVSRCLNDCTKKLA